jgi:mycothiol synthase
VQRIAALSIDATAVDIAERLEADATAVAGHSSLGEAVWRDLDHPGADSRAVVAFRGEQPVALLHVARSDTFAPRHWALGAVFDPEVPEGALLPELLAAAEVHVAQHDGGRMVLWLFGADHGDAEGKEAALQAAGFARERDLYEMRVPLPVDEQTRFPASMTLRTFEPGRDEQQWLVVNNRAFANHPEQGGWIESTLERRMAEPWFDPSIFLVAEDDAGMIGFNWCKIHEAHHRDPALGEIFVIGVDPRTQGTGLGRALAVEGLHRLHQRGVTTGMLFVAAENERAVSLYRSLGFSVHRTDRAYARTVEAVAEPS